MSPKAKTKKTEMKKPDREVRFDKVTADCCLADTAITQADAKELLGWEEELEGSQFGSRFLFKDERGVKVRCNNNVTNRPLNMANARLLAKEILLGNWVFNGEPIIVGKTGLLLNGQHTLIGLVLACQLWEADKDRWGWWKSEPSIDKMVVSGVDESDKTVNTMDTCKPRMLWEVICRSEHFAMLEDPDRRICSRYAESACKLLKARAGADINAFTPKWTHAEYLDLIARHPRLLECIKHVHEENGDKKRIGSFISPGYAAGFLYLMGSSLSDGVAYRSGDPPSEKMLDWSRWDQAQNFFVLMAAGSPDLDGYRKAWASMMDQDRVSNAERWALLVNAWCLWVDKQPVTVKSLVLEYIKDEDGYETLVETPTVGGIDLGDPDEADEAEIPLDPKSKVPDPKPEEIQARKEKLMKEKGRQMPVLRPARAGKEWAAGDVAWVKDPDGEHYLAELLSDPWAVENAKGEKTDRLLADVRDSRGNEWEIDLTDLFLMRPNGEGKKAPATQPAKAGKKDVKQDAWKTGDVAWAREKGGEDWRGKIQEISTNSAKLKVMTGFQGAGNVKTVWLKNLRQKQPLVAT